MKLIAIKALRYAGMSLLPEEEFEASAKDARLLKAIGKAADAPEPPATVEPTKQAVRKQRAKTGE